MLMRTWTWLLFPMLGVLDFGLRIRDLVILDLGLWISLCTAVTLPKFCLKSLKFTSRHWLYCLCTGVTLNLREVRFAIRLELKSIECLIGNVVPLVAYVQKSKEWEFQVD